MTQHADLSRSPARSRAARRTGALGAVLLAGAVLVGSALPPAAATGPTTTRAAADATVTQPLATTTSAEAGALDVAVTDISHPVSHPGDEVTIRAKVTNTSDAAVSDAVTHSSISVREVIAT